MHIISKSICTIVATSALVAAGTVGSFASDTKTPVLAFAQGFDTEAAAVTTTASTQSNPFSGLSGPSGPSGLFPSFIALSFGMLLSSDDVKRFDGIGNEFFNFRASDSRIYDGQMGWNLRQDALTTTFLLLGFYAMNNDIHSVTAGGATGPFDGSYKNRGVYVGLGAEVALAAGASMASAINPAFGASLAVGYGWNEVERNGAAFNPKSNGVIGRAEAYLKFQIASQFFVIPSIVAIVGPSRAIDQNVLTYAMLKLMYQFGPGGDSR